MSGFEDRKDAYENKFAHDEEVAFKIEARTSKLFGLWAAEQLGLEGADAETYAKEVIAANLEEPGFDDIKRKVMPDFEEKGLDIAESLIDKQLQQYEAMAEKQITEDSK